MQEKLSEIIHFHSNSDGVWVYRMDWRIGTVQSLKDSSDLSIVWDSFFVFFFNCIILE